MTPQLIEALGLFVVLPHLRRSSVLENPGLIQPVSDPRRPVQANCYRSGEKSSPQVDKQHEGNGGQAMIQLTDINGRTHAIHPDAIARLVEPGSSGKWHGINCYVRTFDGDTIEARESVSKIMQMIEAKEAKP